MLLKILFLNSPLKYLNHTSEASLDLSFSAFFLFNETSVQDLSQKYFYFLFYAVGPWPVQNR